MSELKVWTYNTRGIRDFVKRREIFYHMHQNKVDIAMLQETHSIKSDEAFWSSQWGSKIWFSHKTTQSKGVAILFSKKIKADVHQVVRLQEGRTLLIYVTIDRKKWLLANIYAPNQDTPEFYSSTFKAIESFTSDYVLVRGDLNLAIDPIIDRRGTTNNNKSAMWLRTHMANIGLIDIWISLKEDQPGYTWRKMSPKPTFSRLDYFLISEAGLQFIKNIQLQYGFKTDHSIVQIIFNPNTSQKGPGYWKFNNTLLRNIDYVNGINTLIEIELENSKDRTPKEQWELLKLAIRGSTIQFALRKKKSDNNKQMVLGN